jgi:hypothetical protein
MIQQKGDSQKAVIKRNETLLHKEKNENWWMEHNPQNKYSYI